MSSISFTGTLRTGDTRIGQNVVDSYTMVSAAGRQTQIVEPNAGLYHIVQRRLEQASQPYLQDTPLLGGLTFTDVQAEEFRGPDYRLTNNPTAQSERLPPIEEYCTTQYGEPLVALKDQTVDMYSEGNTRCRRVISKSVGLQNSDRDQFDFVGAANTPVVIPQHGMALVSKFTAAFFGKITTVNNSNNVITAGSLLEWCFYDDRPSKSFHVKKKQRVGTSLIILRECIDAFSPYFVGTALTDGAPGEHFDVFFNTY